MSAAEVIAASWLRRKLASFRFAWPPRGGATTTPTGLPFPIRSQPLFDNSFQIDDVGIFDDSTLAELVGAAGHGLEPAELGRSAPAMRPELQRRIRGLLTPMQRQQFDAAARSPSDHAAAVRAVLDALFWELTYWKTPHLYEELTEGEQIHPGIFRRLAPRLAGATVLDAGAGSGRATIECIRAGAGRVYAIEPSTGLLRLLVQKVERWNLRARVVTIRGRFETIPLCDNSVDIALACSSFTAAAGQGGESGLTELMRVTKPGGRVVVIWPRVEDHGWLARHGFRYDPLPLDREMVVRFRSLKSAVRCAQRFYSRRPSVLRYLRRHQRPEVPFSVLGFNPPHDYCWLPVRSQLPAG